MQIYRPSILCVCVEWADKVICSRSCWNVSRLIAGIIITGLLATTRQGVVSRGGEMMGREDRREA